MLNQNDIEYLTDRVQCGKMTASQANVEKVRMQRVLVVSKLPRDVRTALNAAVKSGLLKRKKKDGLMPEVYYHPRFEHLAIAKRKEIAASSVKAIAAVMARL
jgi:hypothetical protein